MKLRNALTIMLCAYLLLACTSENYEKLKGNYLGQAEPTDSATLFAPKIVSNQFNVRDAALSPDGNEFFYSLRGVGFFSIISIKREKNIWRGPKVASFSGRYSDFEPCFSPDGKRLYFVSNRPLDDSEEPKDYDIWFVEKEGSNWGEPRNLGEPINTEANEFYPSFTTDGTIYFCAEYEHGIGGEDLYYSRIVNGKYQTPINLGDSVNSKHDEFNSFVSPNGDYIMFGSTGWGKGFGEGDIWISFKDENNNWRKPINMGAKINSKYFEYCPSLTPDGKYLFFTSNKTSIQKHSQQKILTALSVKV